MVYMGIKFYILLASRTCGFNLKFSNLKISMEHASLTTLNMLKVPTESIQHVNSLVLEKVSDILTLNVRGPSYLGLTRSISWQLMPWLLTSPGHQQP